MDAVLAFAPVTGRQSMDGGGHSDSGHSHGGSGHHGGHHGHHGHDSSSDSSGWLVTRARKKGRGSPLAQALTVVVLSVSLMALMVFASAR
ncbi:hypothetical protein [Streptomyces sp. NPDC048106]|uniref:hypothetical protein n=1 Tax=Streptomyces sp. NPDC048106 TaxID=3155750 RepID=UPI003456F28F